MERVIALDLSSAQLDEAATIGSAQTSVHSSPRSIRRSRAAERSRAAKPVDARSRSIISVEEEIGMKNRS